MQASLLMCIFQRHWLFVNVSNLQQTPETGGASAVAIPFTLGEASIGFAQIADGLFGEADPNSSLHSTGSIPGIVTAEAGGTPEEVQLADAMGQFISGVFSGGNILGGAKDATGAAVSIYTGRLKQGTVQGLQAYDAYNDTTGVVEASKAYVESNQYQSSGKELSKKEVNDIKNFIDGQ